MSSAFCILPKKIFSYSRMMKVLPTLAWKASYFFQLGFNPPEMDFSYSILAPFIQSSSIYCIFIWESERDRDNLLVHSSNACDGQGWGWGKESSSYMRHHHCLPGSILARMLEPGVRVGTEFRYSSGGCQFPNH